MPEPGVCIIRIPDFEQDTPDLVRQGLIELIDNGIEPKCFDKCLSTGRPRSQEQSHQSSLPKRARLLMTVWAKVP
ncbi:MAG: hypothetical protein WED83_07660 [Acidimicrobiia bacterium]